MSLRELYEAVLIEVNKESAPNITLDDFNYMANKAVYQYVNKRYNIYDISQQTTDDLRVLKATAVLPVTATPYSEKFQFITEDFPQGFIDNFTFMHATYQVELPDDYFHLLNCECFYKVNFTHKCNNQGEVARAKATRLTADAWNQVVDNFWNRPTYNRPYYYIHNVNTSTSVPTNPVDISKRGTDKVGVQNSNSIGSDAYDISEQLQDPFKTIDISGFITDSGVTYPQKHAQVRYGNASKVLMEIRYGEDDSVYKLFAVMVDYIKAPQHLRLTQTQLDKTLDTSQILEFPDYVCQEITNELVHIIMENQMDPKLQTHPLVSQSIANPAQQQAPETQQQN